jgi:hypothetical protein
MSTERQSRHIRIRGSEPRPAAGTLAWHQQQLRIITGPERTMSLSAIKTLHTELMTLYDGMAGTLCRPMVAEELEHLERIYVLYGGFLADLKQALPRY